MTRVVPIHGAVPTSLTEAYECAIPAERVLSLYVANTTAGNLTFSLVLDQDGAQTTILPEVVCYPGETFEWIPGLYLLTKYTQSDQRVVGDKLYVEASDTGLDMHLFIEQLDPE